MGDAVHRRHLVAQVADLGGGQVVVDEDEVVGHHAKILAQLGRACNAGHILGQGVKQGVVHVRFALGQRKGDDEHDGDHQHPHRVAGHKMAQPGQLGDEGAVLVFFHLPVKEQDEGGQDDDGAHHAQRHALGHHNADVPAQRQPHGTQGQKARNGGQAGSGDGGGGLTDGPHHGFLVGGGVFFFLLVAVEQEDGKIHRHAQLQHRRQCFGDEADVLQKEVGAKVVHQREQQPRHEQQRRDGALQRQKQHQQAGPAAQQ